MPAIIRIMPSQNNKISTLCWIRNAGRDGSEISWWAGEFITSRFGYCDRHVENSDIFNHVQKCKCRLQNYSYFPNQDEFVRFNSGIPSIGNGMSMEWNILYDNKVLRTNAPPSNHEMLRVKWVIVDGGWAEENLTPETGTKNYPRWSQGSK